MTTRVAFKQALGKGRRGRELVFSLNTPALQEFVTRAVSGAFTSPGGTQVRCKFGRGRGGKLLPNISYNRGQKYWNLKM